MVDKAGQHEAMVAPTCARALAQEASWAQTTLPLFDFSVYRLAIYRQRGHQSVGRAVIHGSSSS